MNNITRKWDLRFLSLASEVSTWSKDPSTKIGAVIVGSKGQIISQGYNGFPRGISDYPERYQDRELKYKYIVHAEENAILNAIHNGASTVDSILYVSGGIKVCHNCAKSIIQAGICRVVVESTDNERWEESTDFATSMFREALVQYDDIRKI
jgi:dCMP deaminase